MRRIGADIRENWSPRVLLEGLEKRSGLMGQFELGFLLLDHSLVLIVGGIIWVSAKKRLGHVSDMGLGSIKSRVVLRGLFRCKL